MMQKAGEGEGRITCQEEDRRAKESKRERGTRGQKWAHADGSAEHISKVCSQLIIGTSPPLAASREG